MSDFRDNSSVEDAFPRLDYVVRLLEKRKDNYVEGFKEGLSNRGKGEIKMYHDIVSLLA
jgi:hypothetical protein